MKCGEQTEGKDKFIHQFLSECNVINTTDNIITASYNNYKLSLCKCNTPLDWYFFYQGRPVDAFAYYCDDVHKLLGKTFNNTFDDLNMADLDDKSDDYHKFHGTY